MIKRIGLVWGPVAAGGLAVCCVLASGCVSSMRYPTESFVNDRWDAAEENSRTQFGAIHGSLESIGQAVSADNWMFRGQSEEGFDKLAAAVEEAKSSSNESWSKYEIGGVGLLSLVGSWFGFGRMKKKEDDTTSRTADLIDKNVKPLMDFIRESGFAVALNTKPPETPAQPPMPPV